MTIDILNLVYNEISTNRKLGNLINDSTWIQGALKKKREKKNIRFYQGVVA